MILFGLIIYAVIGMGYATYRTLYGGYSLGSECKGEDLTIGHVPFIILMGGVIGVIIIIADILISLPRLPNPVLIKRKDKNDSEEV